MTFDFAKTKPSNLIAAVDIGGTKIAGALVYYSDETDVPQIMEPASVPTDAKRGGIAVLSSIEEVCRKLIEVAGGREHVGGIGIDTAGIVDPTDGSILYANEIMPGWTGQPVKAHLEEAFGLPVAVMSDVQAHALGEARFGAAKDAQSCLTVGIGTGLGGAYVLEGRVVRGFHGAAGHIGHTLHPAANGITCSCGLSAHTETVTSGTAISAAYQGKELLDELDPTLMGDTVATRANEGERRAIEVLGDAGFALGEAIGSWCNILDPECVVLSGSVCKAGPIWRNAVEDGFQSQILPPLSKTPIVEGKLGGAAPIIGAAENLRDSL